MWYGCISGSYIYLDLSRDLKGCFFPQENYSLFCSFTTTLVRSNNALSTNAAEGTLGES